jgi:cell division protein FtsW (lipid II flippase)
VTFPPIQTPHPNRLIQERLLWLAFIFLTLFSLILTLAPAVRFHTFAVSLNWLHWAGFMAWAAGVGLIHREIYRAVPEADPYIFPTVALLSGWGLLTIWRLDANLGARQTLWLILGIMLVRAALRAPDLLERLRRYKYIWLTIGLLITAATFVVGIYPGGEGPHLWLGCCGLYFQPSEPLKLLLIIYLASYLSDRLPANFSLFSLLAPTLAVITAAAGLLLAQRDLGTATLIIAIYTLVLYLASGRKLMLVFSLAGLAAGAFLGFQLFSVVQVRFNAWINPWQDPSGNSYQIIQSLMALASGGIFGHGPGLGSPGAVPIAHSDFIFAAIAEEGGLLGVIGLLSIYSLLVGRGLKLAVTSPVRNQRYLAAGISTYFAVQSILIAGGTIRLLPLTGVTLPFVSYGGSSLLTSLAALVLLIFCSTSSEEEPAPLLRPAAYRHIAALVSAGVLALGLISAWWMIVRQNNLLNRTDNPRRYITERFVRRGALLDRGNRPLVESTLVSGDYQRIYHNPDFSIITGYNSPFLGQSGLEAGLDNYLRGIQGAPSSHIWWHALVYAQTPPGLDVRLTIDQDFQELADTLLSGRRGSAVLMNARSGEILAIASHPGFDSNQLSTGWDGEKIAGVWDGLMNAPDAPLFNRATQSRYQPGPLLGPFLMAESIERAVLPETPALLWFNAPPGFSLECAQPLEQFTTVGWGDVIRSGCPAPLVNISKQFLPSQMDDLFNRLGFYQAPALVIPTAPETNPPAAVERTDLAAAGFENLSVSPLQLALAASALSAEGKIPEPILAMAVNTPEQGWVILPGGRSRQVFSAATALATANALAQPAEFYWQSLARAGTATNPLTWYLAGTLPRWQGLPLVVVIVLEEDNTRQAELIGRELLRAAVQ